MPSEGSSPSSPTIALLGLYAGVAELGLMRPPRKWERELIPPEVRILSPAPTFLKIKKIVNLSVKEGKNMTFYHWTILVIAWILLFGVSIFSLRKADISGIVNMDTEAIVLASAFVPPFAIMFVIAMTLAKRTR